MTQSLKKNWPSATVSAPSASSVQVPLHWKDLELMRLITHTGTDPNRPTLVAIKGTVFDVSRNAAYGPSGQYRGKLPTST